MKTNDATKTEKSDMTMEDTGIVIKTVFLETFNRSYGVLNREVDNSGQQNGHDYILSKSGQNTNEGFEKELSSQVSISDSADDQRNLSIRINKHVDFDTKDSDRIRSDIIGIDTTGSITVGNDTTGSDATKEQFANLMDYFSIPEYIGEPEQSGCESDNADDLSQPYNAIADAEVKVDKIQITHFDQLKHHPDNSKQPGIF